MTRAGLLGLIAMLLGLCAVPAAAQESIVWAGGVAGGGWDAISTGMAALIHEKAGITVRVVPGGGTRNPVLLARGDAGVGMGMPVLLAAAQGGEDPYVGRRMDGLRGLVGNVSLNVFHFYVAADSPFAEMTIDQIVGSRKPIRLAISRPGTADVWGMEKILAHYGLCVSGKTSDCYRAWESVGAKFVRGSYAEQAVAFRSRKVDGTFALLALPATSIVEASEQRRLKLLPFPRPLVDDLARYGFGDGSIPAGTYPKAVNAGEDITSASVGTTIAVSVAMSDDLAYRITRAINDNPDLVRRIHPSLANYDPASGHLHLGVPLHPGAERYYREKGWLP
jgi:TRAP transporter TAXI family solute receptor